MNNPHLQELVQVLAHALLVVDKVGLVPVGEAHALCAFVFTHIKDSSGKVRPDTEYRAIPINRYTLPKTGRTDGLVDP